MKPHVYIMTNKSGSVLYTGVTSDIKGRMLKHKMKKYPRSFTARYNVYKLVYYEACDSMMEAIKREKQIKAGSRYKKEVLINSINPGWEDLSLSLPD
jgi:putative endonuclease